MDARGLCIVIFCCFLLFECEEEFSGTEIYFNLTKFYK